MHQFIAILLLILLLAKCDAHSDAQTVRDIYPDTWVGSDALGRTMPGVDDVGPAKTDQRRVVGIFYITWHSDNLHTPDKLYTADVSKILAADPAARFDGKHPLWGDYHMYHWGEPEAGYFLSKDEYVIRQDMSMLADAGVDVLVMDVTNAVRYWDEWDTLFPVMQRMKAEGNKVPQFCFWAFNGPVITVVQDLYEKVYKEKRFEDLWFMWYGKPLLLYNRKPNFDAGGQRTEEQDYSQEVKDFFTLRTMWWGYYEWAGERFIGTEDNWSFGYDMSDPRVNSMDPDDRLSTHNGRKEQAAVTPGQHPISLTGKSWTVKHGQPKMNDQDMPVPTYVPWLGRTVKNPEGYGIYFQQRWEEALESDPQFLYINDWNEWTAGKYPPPSGDTVGWLLRDSPYYFVDQYNSEFNRCVQPMKGGYTDNYYMQMAQNIRRYKGVRPIPQLKGYHNIKIDGDLRDWKHVKVEYLDTVGDTAHRDYIGYGGLHYTNDLGRNDIVASKVAVGPEMIYFLAETNEALTKHTGRNWMLLFIDADKNPDTGWFGYDYLINKDVVDARTTTLMRYAPNGQWVKVADLDYRYRGKALEIAIPRTLLGLNDDAFTFDFKWCDNPADLIDPISLCVSGDTAPNRRFNYRCVWRR